MRIPAQQGLRLGPDPGEVVLIRDDSVLERLDQAGAQVGRMQGAQHRRIGEDRNRRMKRSHQVFPVTRIDAGFPAH